ncbi:MAG: response regulator transcription factor [Parabacteroides sp.]
MLILADTLQCVGLHTLLTEYFSPVEVSFCSSYQEVFKACQDYDIYITVPDMFVMHTDFFLPRRNKTWILTQSHEHNDGLSGINHICTTDSKDGLVEQLRDLFANDTNGAGEDNKGLSQREIDVLQLVATGITNKEIADKLHISLNTVLSHRKNITTKLGIKTVSGLTFYAIMNGLIAGSDIE